MVYKLVEKNNPRDFSSEINRLLGLEWTLHNELIITVVLVDKDQIWNYIREMVLL